MQDTDQALHPMLAKTNGILQGQFYTGAQTLVRTVERIANPRFSPAFRLSPGPEILLVGKSLRFSLQRGARYCQQLRGVPDQGITRLVIRGKIG